MTEKIRLGQFYTVSNPFKNNIFFKWYKNIENIEKEIILEPFAGENNIIELIQSLYIPQPKSWKCYDIKQPEKNRASEFSVDIRDCLKSFPKGYRVAITNPPYMARNRATRMGLEFDNSYDDLYMKCLDIMLENVEYVAAIIPESFITYPKFKERLYAIISLEQKMFDDTDCPVCLALFNPQKTDEYIIVKKDEIVGTNLELEKYIIDSNSEIEWKFNDPNGEIGLIAVDNTSEASIKFVEGTEITNEIKISSRSMTRISGFEFEDKQKKEEFLKRINKNLKKYREVTQDVFLTSFKGLRKDLRYRRRLDYKTARNLLNKTYLEVYKGEYGYL